MSASLTATNKTVDLLAAAALVAMLVTAYIPALQAGFIWDDPAHITENTLLLDTNGLVRIWTEAGAHQQFYPLTLTIFWLEYQLWGLAPLGYHLVNILLHATAALLVWRLGRRMGLPGAWAAAAVFGLHPVHVESVAWATELKNVLSGVFYLASLWFMFGYYRLYPAPPANSAVTADEPNSRFWRLYAPGLAFFVCAVLSKTVTSTLPAALLVLVWWRRGRVRLVEVLPLIPFFVAGIGLGLVTISREIDIGATGEAFGFSFIDRLLIAGRALWFYVAKLLWPVDLNFNYTRWQIDSRAIGQYLYPAAALLFFAALWRLRDRIGRGPLAAALFFSGTLFPALGFFNVYPMQFSFVADHFQYLASLAPIVAVTTTLAGSVAAWRSAHAGRALPAAGLALAVLLGLYGLKTWELGHYYKNSETLYTWIISQNPESFLAHYNLGTELMLAGHVDAAIPHLQETMRIKPRYARAYVNLGTAYASRDALDLALPLFHRAVEIDPSLSAAHLNLGQALMRVGDLNRARDVLARARELDPKDPQVFYLLGYVHGQAGDFEAAIGFLRQTLALKPDFPQAAELLERARFELQRRAQPQ